MEQKLFHAVWTSALKSSSDLECVLEKFMYVQATMMQEHEYTPKSLHYIKKQLETHNDELSSKSL